MHPTLKTLLALGALSGCATEPARPLEASRAATLRGGARVDVLWPTQNNWAQSYDDLAFRAQIADEAYNTYGYDSAEIALWSENAVGAGKHAYTMLDTHAPNASTIWQTRVTWPTKATGGGKPDLSYRFFWPETQAYYVATGTSSRLDMYLHRNVKVAEVQLYSLNSRGVTATANWARYSAILDVKNYGSPDLMDNLTDGIYRQCGDPENNDDLKHWQVRLLPQVKQIAVDAATEDGITFVPCTDMLQVLNTYCPGQTGRQSLTQCPEVMECMDDMLEAADADDVSTRVPVFHVSTTPFGSNTSFVWNRPGGRFTAITLNHMNSSQEFFARLFSHEMGHRILGLGDLQTPASQQSPANARCAWDPNNGVSDDIHPLMCSASPGRFLYASECTTAYASSVTDWNDQ